MPEPTPDAVAQYRVVPPRRPGGEFRPMEVEPRFWAKVDKSGDCWRWTGFINRYGYGTFKLEGRVRSAHRVAYELVVGPSPNGLTLDHLCRNRACVNPAHLEAVTMRVNGLRGDGPQARNFRRAHPEAVI